MRGVYLCSSNAARLAGNAGVYRKIRSQAATLGELVGSCRVVFYEPPSSFRGKLLARLPFAGGGNSFPDPKTLADCDFLYIRKPHITSEFIRYLAAQKAVCGGRVCVLLELPTYPYDKELSEPKNLSLLAKDRAGRRKLGGLVDRIVTFSDHDEIFGIPTVKSFNGIDLRSVRVRSCDWEPAKNGPIEILCCARFSKWHGVDRLVIGLANYYGNGGTRDVRVRMLGEGPELPKLKSMVADNNLGDRVLFYGFQDKEAMDGLYDRCSFAVGSLGLHRLGLAGASTLKSREYIAKGVPFVYAGQIDVLEGIYFPYALQVEPDDSPLDIDSLARFHDELYARFPQAAIAKRMREFAVANVSMERAMSSVAECVIRFHERKG